MSSESTYLLKMEDELLWVSWERALGAISCRLAVTFFFFFPPNENLRLNKLPSKVSVGLLSISSRQKESFYFLSQRSEILISKHLPNIYSLVA